MLMYLAVPGTSVSVALPLAAMVVDVEYGDSVVSPYWLARL